MAAGGPPLSSGVGARSARRHTRRRVPAAPDRRQGRGASGGGEVGPEKVVEGRKSQQTDAVRSQTAAMDDLGESQTPVRRRGLVRGRRVGAKPAFVVTFTAGKMAGSPQQCYGSSWLRPAAPQSL